MVARETVAVDAEDAAGALALARMGEYAVVGDCAYEALEDATFERDETLDD
jgi:hypothetical protein